MKVSIITATFNRAATIKHTLDSLNKQDYPDIEHIIVDGASTDGTLTIINAHKASETILISEPDNGAFDALNKGLKVATGDIVGFLHSDDFFANDHVISDVVATMKKHKVDSVFGDVAFVSSKNINKTVRYYSSKKFHPGRFEYGFMPAHPTFFTKREYYERFGSFNTKYKIAADFELLVRFLYEQKISYKYMDQLMIYMRTGGLSNANLRSRFVHNREALKACRARGIKTSPFKIMLKVISKIPELFVRPSENGVRKFANGRPSKASLLSPEKR